MKKLTLLMMLCALPIVAHADVMVQASAPTSNATVSYVNITGLSWTVAANTTYFYDCYIVYNSTSLVTGINVSNNGPVSPTLNDYDVGYQNLGNALAPAAGLYLWTHQVAYQTGTATTTTVATGTNYSIRVKGVFRNGSTAGTLNWQFKASATNSTTIAQYSYCTYVL